MAAHGQASILVGAAVFVVTLVLLTVLILTGPRVHHVVCDGYGVMSLGDASHPAVYITPPPGWVEYGPGCWGEP